MVIIAINHDRGMVGPQLSSDYGLTRQHRINSVDDPWTGAFLTEGSRLRNGPEVQTRSLMITGKLFGFYEKVA